MELTRMTMDPQDARKAFLEYRDQLDKRRRPSGVPIGEDEALMRAYRELAKGAQLIELSPTMREGGLTTIDAPAPTWWRQNRGTESITVTVPRLMIARADAQFVWTRGVDPTGTLSWITRQGIAPHNRTDRGAIIGLFDHDDDRRLDSWGQIGGRIRARVPHPPLPLRPTRAHLRNYVTLWEAEWEIDHAIPPADPALLKHIGGDLYAVVAQWDLTPLEQAVLRRREVPAT